jgi:hypothetical protein
MTPGSNKLMSADPPTFARWNRVMSCRATLAINVIAC